MMPRGSVLPRAPSAATRPRGPGHDSAPGSRLPVRVAWAFATVLLLILPGCKVGYVLQQAGGQIRILTERRDVSDLLADPETREATKRRLQLVGEMKRFAEEKVGLIKTDNYTTFFDTGGKPVAWSVVACPKDGLSPVTWWFPIVGRVPYLGFFDREDAEEERRELEEEGYDTHMGIVGAYSTLGWFSDPVFSTMLDDDEGDLANLIVHETTHATVYLPDRSQFNESLAEFVGNRGELEWLAGRYGRDSTQIRKSRVEAEDEARFQIWLHRVADRLRESYDAAGSRESRLAAKAAILESAVREWPSVARRMKGQDWSGFDPHRLNNAFLAAYATYNADGPVIEQLYQALGRDLRRVVAFFRDMPDGEDPVEYASRRAADAESIHATRRGVTFFREMPDDPVEYASRRTADAESIRPPKGAISSADSRNPGKTARTVSGPEGPGPAAGIARGTGPGTAPVRSGEADGARGGSTTEPPTEAVPGPSKEPRKTPERRAGRGS